MVGEAKRFMVSNPDAFKPVGNELGVDALVELDINGTKVQVHLNGFIDRLFLDDNGDYHVHELKTGMWKDKKTKYQSMAKEMAFYVYMLSKSTADFGGVRYLLGWDHTKGHRTTQVIVSFVEPVKSKMWIC